jgi:hypothetical protein
MKMRDYVFGRQALEYPTKGLCLDVNEIIILITEGIAAFTPQRLEHVHGCPYCTRMISLHREVNGIAEV